MLIGATPDHRCACGPASCNGTSTPTCGHLQRVSPEEQTALEIIGSDQTTRNRAIYSLFNEASDHAKARKEIEEDGETRMVPVLPWYPKVSLAVDPRQTVIPGTSR